MVLVVGLHRPWGRRERENQRVGVFNQRFGALMRPLIMKCEHDILVQCVYDNGEG